MDDDVATSARESTLARQYLLQQSLRLTMDHPIFGVGPGIFTVGEAELAKSEGLGCAMGDVVAQFQHQVSSEMGTSLLLYLAALGATIGNVFWFRKRSRIDPTGRAYALGLALLLSLVGLCVNLGFSSGNVFSFIWLEKKSGLLQVFRAGPATGNGANGMRTRRERRRWPCQSLRLLRVLRSRCTVS